MLAKRSHLWGLCRSITHPWNEHSQGHQIMLSGRTELPPGFDPRGPKESDWPSIATLANHLVEGARQPAAGHRPSGEAGAPHRASHPRAIRRADGRTQRSLSSSPAPSSTRPATAPSPNYDFHHRRGPRGSTARSSSAPNLTLPQGHRACAASGPAPRPGRSPRRPAGTPRRRLARPRSGTATVRWPCRCSRTRRPSAPSTFLVPPLRPSSATGATRSANRC